jgi:hypothetical protein
MVSLTETALLHTSGARAVEPFDIDGTTFVAVPQIAIDIPEQAPDINAGDSDTSLLVFRADDGRFVEHQRLAVPGGEDAEFFRIDGRIFLATASIRTGCGPYEFGTESRIFEWRAGRFEPFQAVPTFAAKQWKAFTVAGRHFLALAQGVSAPGVEARNKPSTIYEWTGSSFEEFQQIPSEWGYNWHQFELDGQAYLAYADHLAPSMLYRWNGDRFVARQVLLQRAGRAFADFHIDGRTYLVAACIDGASPVMRWEDGFFEPIQELPEAGARELAIFSGNHGLYLARVNFITGSRQQPRVSLNSQLYRWENGKFVAVLEFPTAGGTDVAVLPGPGPTRLAVSNSLSPQVRFASQTVIYTFDDSSEGEEPRR